MENMDKMQHFTQGLRVKTRMLIGASTRGTIKARMNMLW